MFPSFCSYLLAHTVIPGSVGSAGDGEQARLTLCSHNAHSPHSFKPAGSVGSASDGEQAQCEEGLRVAALSHHLRGRGGDSND